MAGDFVSVKAACVAQVLNSHPATAALISSAMVRQLLTLQPEATTFMETSGSWSTTAGAAAYGSSTAGFPKSLLRFERLYYDLGSYTIEIVNTDRTEIRRLQELGSVAYPYRAAWIGNQLQFGPPPSGVFVIKYDGTLDATKDSLTGDTIDGTVAAATNPWFTTGVIAYQHLVLADYFATSPDQRPDLAAAHQQGAALAINSYRQTGAQRLQLGGIYQIPSAFTRNQPASERRQLVFPGAPI